VDYTARDGLKIPAYLTLPPGKTVNSGPMPLIAMPHGGPIARDTAEFDWWAQFLASRGYAVFKPQFRGSTGLGYDYVKKGYGEFGVGMLNDTIDGVKSLVSKGIADADNMCVTGASYGGYQAFALPVAEPDMIECALALNGVSDIPAILKYEVARGGRSGGAIKFWNRVIGDYYDDRDAQRKQSPAKNADKIKAEVVILHGNDDMTVPYEQSEIMAKAMKKQGQSGKVIVLKNDDHFLSLPQSRKKLLEESEKLFAKHLK
jgi:dipeptidyl aminopeptidase/acylaminoacyl peptidase